MGKKKKAKAKVEETIPVEPDKTAESVPEQEDTVEAKPDKDPEPVNKPQEPETVPVEAPAEDVSEEPVPEGMVKIPCECINCKNKFDLYVPKGIGTSILYYRDCEKCR